MEPTLALAALTAAAAAWVGIRLSPDARRLDHPLEAVMGAAALGLLAGRLVRMVGDGVNPLTHPLDLLLVRAGVSTVAATVVALLALGWSWRERLPGALDALATAALLGLAGWEAGCLWRGTCLGTATRLPWGWAQPGSDVLRHPVGLVTAALLVGGALVLLRLRHRPWLASGLALAWASSVRLVTEPLRPSLTGGPVWWYLAGGVSGAVVALLGPRLLGRRAGPVTPS